jgi:Na+/melibiose symporter-like transporter
MLFQTAFGMTPAQSGLLSLMLVVGAFMSRIAGPPMLRWAGMRRYLVTTSLICAALFASCILVRQQTAGVLVASILFATGFFQSLPLVALGAVAYADTGAQRASAATTFYMAVQQATLSVGIVIAVLALHGAQAVLGDTIAKPQDFDIGIAVLALLVLSAAFSTLAFDQGSGGALLGK